MGTLLNQQPRTHYYVSNDSMFVIIKQIEEIAFQTGIDFKDAMEVYKIRQEELKLTMTITDHDIKDEQLAGFGELLIDLISKIDNLCYAINPEFKEP